MRTLALLLLAASLSGCAGLNVSWDFQASYNREVSPINLDLRIPKPAAAEKKDGV